MATAKNTTKQVGGIGPDTITSPDGWSVNKDREAPKKSVDRGGVDREPFRALIRTLDFGQVVELPAMNEKQASSAENMVRAAARDLSLAVRFLPDVSRNESDPQKNGLSYYVWYVKGPFEPRARKAQGA